jgi:hypothetical protein
VTRYTVVWQDKAIQQLARIWNEATDRTAVTRASDRIDRELTADPDQKGSDYFGDRVLPAAPLWALYRVHTDDRRVEVREVGRPGIDLPHDE